MSNKNADKKNEKSNIALSIVPSPIYKVVRCTIKEGPKVCIHKILNRLHLNRDYEIWMKSHETDLYDVETLSYEPKISVIVPVYNVDGGMLRECIDSVRNQTYKKFELVLVDDCSTIPEVREILEEYKREEDKKCTAGEDENLNTGTLSGSIIVHYRKENGHISRATNTGFSLATGEFVALLDCDDVLAPNALYEMAKKLNENPDYDFIYSDEDKLSADGKKRRYPFFKPDWSPDTIMSLMYTCHFAMFRKSLIDELGGMRVGLEGSQDYDLVLRVMEKTNRIGHIAKVLYHWRERKESTAINVEAKPYILEATKRAKSDAIKRRGLKAHLEYLDFCTQYRVVYHVQGNPKVSIIIPSKDHPDILAQCIETVVQYTSYQNYEIVVVDNGSNEKNRKKCEELCEQYDCIYHYEPMDFNFSRMCNLGAALATGEYFLFLNDDIEIPADSVRLPGRKEERIDDWLSRLLGHAQLSHVGAVGCKLLYPNTHVIQHSGVMNLANGPGHAFHQMDDEVRHSWDRNKLEYNFSAVTGACLLVNREKFNKVGGFEETLVIGYNDVDLCIKLLEEGYFNVLRNDVSLVHHESISRGDDRLDQKKAKRLKNERELLFARHPWYRHHDPCYNENLVKDKGDYSIDCNDYSEGIEIVKQKEVHSYEMDTDIENHIVWQLEDVIEDDRIWVKGYAFHKDFKKIPPATLVLTDNDRSQYIIYGKGQYRQDILQIYDNRKVAFCGFQFVFAKTQIENGCYHMGIIVDGTYVDLNYKVEI